MTCGLIHGIRVAHMAQKPAGPFANQMLGGLGGTASRQDKSQSGLPSDILVESQPGGSGAGWAI